MFGSDGQAKPGLPHFADEGGLGKLATRRGLYSATAAEGFEHINIWKSSEELHLMEKQSAGWQ